MTPRPKRTWRYHSIAGHFWKDIKVRALGDDARLLFLYVLTCPERVSEGFYVLSPALAAHRLGWPPERIESAFDSLARAGLAEFDQGAEVVFVCRGLKYNTPTGPPAIKGAVKLLDDAQDAPILFEKFLAAADKYAPDFAQGIRERYGISAEPENVGGLEGASGS